MNVISNNLVSYLPCIEYIESKLDRSKSLHVYEDLNETLTYLKSDIHQSLTDSQLSLRELAKKVFLFKQLRYKLKNIALKIHDKAVQGCLVDTICEDILPGLKEKEKRYELELKQGCRLPQAVNYQREMARIRNYAMEDLQLHICEEGDANDGEKQVFNLIMEKLTDEELKGFDYQELEGASEIYSVLAYSEVLEIYRGLFSSKSLKYKALTNLLTKQNQAAALAQKTILLKGERFHRSKKSSDEYTRKEDKEKLIQYYKLLSDVKNLTPNSRLPIKCKEMPLAIIIHDISQEILESIRQLDYNDYTFFCLGSRKHSVTLEIRRQLNDQGKDEYLFVNFNTGEGVDNPIKSHQLEKEKNGEYIVKPLCINKLSLEAFEYDFLESMVSLILCLDATEDIYALEQAYLVDKHGGQWENDWGNWYPLQKRGSCSYSSLEFCLNSHLDISDKTNMDTIKADLAISKQTKIVEWRHKQCLEASQKLAKDNPELQRLKEKLDQSKKILQLISTCLMRIGSGII